MTHGLGPAVQTGVSCPVYVANPLGGAWHAVRSRAYSRSVDRASSRALYTGSHRNLSPLAIGQQRPRPAALSVTSALVTSFLCMAPRHEPPATHPSCTVSYPQANGARPIRQRASQQTGPGSGSARLGQRRSPTREYACRKDRPHGLCRPLEQSYDAGTARAALGKPDGHPRLWLHGALAKPSLLKVGPRLPDGEVLEPPLVGLAKTPSRAPFSFSFLTQKTSGYTIYL